MRSIADRWWQLYAELLGAIDKHPRSWRDAVQIQLRPLTHQSPLPRIPPRNVKAKSIERARRIQQPQTLTQECGHTPITSNTLPIRLHRQTHSNSTQALLIPHPTFPANGDFDHNCEGKRQRGVKQIASKYRG